MGFGNRPISKLAIGEEFVGDTGHRTAAYFKVREDSSTESTSKLPPVVEFRERYNLFYNNFTMYFMFFHTMFMMMFYIMMFVMLMTMMILKLYVERVFTSH